MPSRRTTATAWLMSLATALSIAFVGNAAAQDINVEIGELPIGRSVTITYRARLKEIPQSTTEVTNQGMVESTSAPLLLTDDPTAPGMNDPTVSPVVARLQDRVSAGEKGSLLYFAAVDLRWSGMAGPVPMLTRDTIITLSNDFPEDVRVKMYFINGDPPLDEDPATGERAHFGWNWVVSAITLTGDQPTYWSVATGLPATGGVAPFTILDPGIPPGRPANDGTTDRVMRGYVIAFAIDPISGEEIRWNHLSGTGTIVDYGNGAAWEYSSYAHAVVAPVDNGMPTGMDPGVLNLDNVEYSASFSQLLMNFQAVGSSAFSGPRQALTDSFLALVPSTADLRQETCGPTTTKASFNVWNENEVKFSGTHRCVTCWDGTLLSGYGGDGVANHFRLAHLQTHHGKARIDGIASQSCNVDVDPSDGPFPPADRCTALGGHPNDVISSNSPLLGVVARLLMFDGGVDHGASGTNLIGMGRDVTGQLQVDLSTTPEEGELPIDPTPEELRAFIDAFLGRYADD